MTWVCQRNCLDCDASECVLLASFCFDRSVLHSVEVKCCVGGRRGRKGASRHADVRVYVSSVFPGGHSRERVLAAVPALHSTRLSCWDPKQSRLPTPHSPLHTPQRIFVTGSSVSPLDCCMRILMNSIWREQKKINKWRWWSMVERRKSL
jgi:hypothetical protein